VGENPYLISLPAHHHCVWKCVQYVHCRYFTTTFSVLLGTLPLGFLQVCSSWYLKNVNTVRYYYLDCQLFLHSSRQIPSSLAESWSCHTARTRIKRRDGWAPTRDLGIAMLFFFTKTYLNYGVTLI